uniref:Uncharacterized protein n=1 Tax=Picea glauca TaxID=3330 RepID=A0A101M314_PICGL|nr:hypothetical protein ABT39_MTgene3255 [Picea glauca]
MLPRSPETGTSGTKRRAKCQFYLLTLENLLLLGQLNPLQL